MSASTAPARASKPKQPIAVRKEEIINRLALVWLWLRDLQANLLALFSARHPCDTSIAG